jgi:hypothetical protein
VNHEQIKVNQLKRDIKILLESFVSAFSFSEDEKSLIRIINGMEATPTNCSVIQACLTRISDKCGELDLNAMEYEAKTLSDRLDALADESDGDSTSCVHADLLRRSPVVR